jgi:hypothetical protein
VLPQQTEDQKIHSADTTMMIGSVGILISVFLPLPVPAQFALSSAVAPIARSPR